ncbi:MAG: phenylacetate--CoA ligase, partial [Dethiobacteria bacterium]
MWNPTYEAMDREKLETVQFLRLKQTLERVYHLVPFYRNRFKEAGVEPGDIRSLKDLALLPFTVKDDLRDNFPFG